MGNNSNALALFIGLGKVLSLLLSFLVPVILVRLLDKSDYGVYSQFNMVFLSVATFFSFGVRSNLVYFYNKLEKSYIKAALTQTIIVILFLSLVAIGLLNFSFFQNYFLGGNKELLGFVLLLSLAVMFQMVSSVTETLYIVKRDKVVGFLYPALSVLIKAFLVIYLVHSFGTLRAAIIGVVVALFVLVSFNAIYLFREYKQLPTGKYLNKQLLKEQVNYSAPFGISNSVKEVASKFDKYMALSFLNSSTYASYAVAFTTIPGVMAIYDSLAQVYLMDMVKQFKAGNMVGTLNIYKDLVAKSLSFTIPLLVLFMCFADVIIPFIFTEKYSDSVILFRIYIPTLLFIVLGSDLIIRASGKTGLSLRAQVLSLFLSLPLTYLLINTLGVEGAAIGSAIATVLPLLLLASYSMRILNTNLLRFLPWDKILMISLITMLGFIPTYLLSFYLERSIQYFIVSVVISGSVIFILEYHYDLLFVEKSNIDNIFRKLGKLFV